MKTGQILPPPALIFLGRVSNGSSHVSADLLCPENLTEASGKMSVDLLNPEISTRFSESQSVDLLGPDKGTEKNGNRKQG